MVAVTVPSGLGAPGRSRVRGIGAAAAVLAFFGTAAMAPFSVADSFALQHGAGAFSARAEQELAPEAAALPALDLHISAVESGADGVSSPGGAPSGALYTLSQFMFSGAVNWGGYRFTYYSQQVLPGNGLQIPGRHVNAGGYVSDGDGYIVLAGSAPKGTVYETPFGYRGKIYDRGTAGNHLDVYIR